MRGTARATLQNRKAPVSGFDGPGRRTLRRWSQQTTNREATMKKLVFIAVVAVAAIAVILDDGRPRLRRRWQ